MPAIVKSTLRIENVIGRMLLQAAINWFKPVQSTTSYASN